MIGYATVFVAALISLCSFVFMDLDSKHDFYSLFLPFSFAISLLFCFAAAIFWIFFHFGPATSSDDSGAFSSADSGTLTSSTNFSGNDSSSSDSGGGSDS
jgi:drug/metabolite transporter (DMT)-like permease